MTRMGARSTRRWHGLPGSVDTNGDGKFEELARSTGPRSTSSTGGGAFADSVAADSQARRDDAGASIVLDDFNNPVEQEYTKPIKIVLLDKSRARFRCNKAEFQLTAPTSRACIIYMDQGRA